MYQKNRLNTHVEHLIAPTSVAQILIVVGTVVSVW